MNELSHQISISLALQVIGLNRSSYYYDSKPKSLGKVNKSLDPNLSALLNQLTGYELTLGYRKTAGFIQQNYGHLGYCYNHKKVYRHMKLLNLLQPKHIRKPKLRKKIGVSWYSPIRSNRRWEADLTYIASQDGNIYLFVVIDVFDREIIGEWIGFRCRAIDAVQSLEMAILKRFPQAKVPDNLELILRLDRGCQYTAEEFGSCARKFNLKLEFCDVQAPNQKPFIESFFANFKREEVYRNEYSNSIHVIKAWKSFVDWYNLKRPHGALNFLSPVQFKQRIAIKNSFIFS